MELEDSSTSLGKRILSLTARRHNPPLRRLRKSRRKSKPVERPLCVLGEDRITQAGQVSQLVANSRVPQFGGIEPRIPDGDARVAQEAAPLRAFHRASAKHFLKFPLAERNQPFQV